MISSLSTYIQFLAAIYVTICLDNVIGKRFWSPNYYDLVTNELSIFKRFISSPKQELLEKEIKRKAKQLDDRSRKRGTLMLFYCALLMFYSSFECDYVSTIPACSQSFLSYFPFFVVLMISLTLVIFYDYIFKRWRRLLLVILFQTIMFVICLILIKNFCISKQWLFIKYTKLIIAFLLPIPIIHQLYFNWLYSTAYLFYLKCEVRDEFEKYQTSKKAYEQKDKNMADKSYYQAFTNILLDNNPDNILTELNKTLYEHLEKRCTPPSSFDLFKFWIKRNDDENLPTIPQSLSSEEENMSVNRELEHTYDRSKYDQYYNEYEAINPKSKLKFFCLEKGLNYDDFRVFYNITKKKQRR